MQATVPSSAVKRLQYAWEPVHPHLVPATRAATQLIQAGGHEASKSDAKARNEPAPDL